MRTAFAWGAALALAACSGTTRDARTPEQTVDAFYAALAAGNAALALSLLSSDVIVFEIGRIDRSRKDYAAAHLSTDMAVAAGARRELLSRRSVGNSELRAIASTYNEIAANQTSTTTETVVLRKAAETWQIVHLHWTVEPAATRAR